MKKVSKIFIRIGLFLLIVCPLYQRLDALLKNNPGGEAIVSGDNPVFRQLIGIKTTYSWFIPSSGWEETGDWKIVTPSWMQSVGLPKVVVYGSQLETGPGNQDTTVQIIVWFLRWSIKIMIPGIFFLIGFFLQKKEKNLEPQAL